MIQNPIIKGFNPDPSFLRVGDDYYIATSTFEWFPGVAIHHSKDLVHWELVGHGLNHRGLLDLLGVPNSGGIWAPSLSWDKGKFCLGYTVVRTWGMGRPFKDHHNYLVTADRIEGPWSDPIFLNSSGFDASLFHDDDGRKWLTQIQWDFRKGKPRFGGIILQEYDPLQKKMTGPVSTILQKDTLIEGPNLYRRKGWYYLMLAEGGTGWNHSISMARSRLITGPYEVDPWPALLTSRDDESLALQKAGHGELVQTQNGEWYLAHLASRPLGEGANRRCIMGRETCLQKVRWSDEGWLRLESGGTHPRMEVPAPAGIPDCPLPVRSDRDDFDSSRLDVNWSSLRVPVDESWLSLRERPGWLRLRGRESLHSLHEQSMIVRRIQSTRLLMETRLECSPTHFTQLAGLICWYDTATHFYLRVTHDEMLGLVLGIVLTDDGIYDELTDCQIEINDWPACYLRALLNQGALQFSASPDGRAWRPVGPVLDGSHLSDDYGKGLHFTGAMAGLRAQDLNGNRIIADFDYWVMRPHQHVNE